MNKIFGIGIAAMMLLVGLMSAMPASANTSVSLNAIHVTTPTQVGIVQEVGTETWNSARAPCTIVSNKTLFLDGGRLYIYKYDCYTDASTTTDGTHTWDYQYIEIAKIKQLVARLGDGSTLVIDIETINDALDSIGRVSNFELVFEDYEGNIATYLVEFVA
jgi:hypothetical protein